MSSVVIAGDTSGSVTLQAPAIAGSTVLTLPSTSGTLSTSGGFSQAQVLTTSGTFTVPASGKFKVTLVGGGGGGSGNNGQAGSGGGGGGSAVKWYSGVASGTVCTVTIGAGGAGGAVNNPGVTGGNSSFTGTGVTTLTSNGGPGASLSSTVPIAGGTATGGDINIPGGTSGGYQLINGNGNSVARGASGGSTLLGFGGAGASRQSQGANGSGYGAGGGGGGALEGNVAGLPGSGTAGVCVVEF